jgi:hypothetical protein
MSQVDRVLLRVLHPQSVVPALDHMPVWLQSTGFDYLETAC